MVLHWLDTGRRRWSTPSVRQVLVYCPCRPCVVSLSLSPVVVQTSLDWWRRRKSNPTSQRSCKDHPLVRSSPPEYAISGLNRAALRSGVHLFVCRVWLRSRPGTRVPVAIFQSRGEIIPPCLVHPALRPFGVCIGVPAVSFRITPLAIAQASMGSSNRSSAAVIANYARAVK